MISNQYHDTSLRLVFLSIILFHVNTANAVQIDYTLEGGIEYSDNVTLTYIDPVSSAMRRAILFADMHDETDTVSYYFRPRVSHTNYKNDQLEDRTFYGLDASLSWEIIPRGFSWSFDDFLGQTAIDAADPLTTFNQQTTNVFLTGPDMILRLGSNRRFEALLRYADFYYETGDIDNQRYGGLFRLISESNDVHEFSLNVESADVSYDDPELNENYKRDDAYIGFRGEGRRGNIIVDTGYTKINREVSEDLNGFIGRIQSEIQLNSRSNLTLYGHAQYTDSSRSFLISRAYLTGIRTFDTQISANILYEKYAYIGYTWSQEPNAISFEISKVDQDYDDTLDPYDRTVNRASLEFDRDLTRLTSIYISGYWANSYYTTTFIEDKDSDYFIGLGYRLSRSLALRARLGYRERNSTDVTRNFEENSAYLFINYSNRQ